MSRLVTVSGPPGAGKTTLAKALSGALGATLVEFDRYEAMTRAPPATLSRWQKAGSPYDALVTPAMTRALEQALADGDVVFDTPLGPAAPLPRAPDLAVWIDIPADIALARKIAQLSQGVPAEHQSEFLGWLQGYLARYAEITFHEIQLQRDRVPRTATLTVSGLDTTVNQLTKCKNRL